MLTDPKLRSQVDSLWDKFWSGGLTNPLDAIEQFSYLLFLKRLDDAENQHEKLAKKLGKSYTPGLTQELRWGQWTRYEAGKALAHLKETIFPWFRTLGEAGSSFERYMANAECKINKPSLLIEACKLIDQMEISQQNQDVQGDLYEYLLSKLNTAGRNGQFRTPRHIIRMMVQMIAPRPTERIGDLAAGTGGFLVNAYQHILERHTSPGILEYDAEGLPHHLIGDLLSEAEHKFIASGKFLRGFDNDSGMTMLRIGSMNLMLHGIEAPQFFYTDTLSKAFSDERDYDVILMNPPFKGAIDKGDVSPTLPGDTTKTELLFVHLILRVLDMGGRCAVIAPDGVLFGSSKAHVALRKRLIEENRLDGVVSMPSGVFKPYAGVSTAVLFFTRGAKTEKIWFYDMAGDGFSLDDKRTPGAHNDIPDVVTCWQKRQEAAFLEGRARRVEQLRAALAPMKAERRQWLAEINRLTFENVIANGEGEAGPLKAAQQALAALEAQIAPLQAEMEQLRRQFWVTKEQVRANKYDLSASRYRPLEADEAWHAAPRVTLERMAKLEQVIGEEIEALRKMLESQDAL
ncbi:MAG: N-6 DNA methylase [Anaerolineales bacterium]|nr:N-6 DNA methylase [Anaerolineales bacterium]